MRFRQIFFFVVVGFGLLLAFPIGFAQSNGAFQQYIPLVRHVDGIPDGYTAYVESDADGDADIYRVTDSGRMATSLTTNDIGDYAPLLSPNDSQILYSRSSPTEGQRLYVMNADGTNNHLLATLPAYSFGEWSPDGERILISQTYEENNTITGQFYIANPDRTDALLSIGEFTDIHQAYGKWSPTQNEVLLTICQSPELQWCRLYVVSAETGEPTFLYEGLTQEQIWSADGSKVFFTANDGTDFELYEIRRTGTGQRILTANNLDDTRIRLGADNSVIVTRRLDPDRQAYGLFLVNPDQQSEIPLVPVGWFPTVLDQSADRGTILYTLYNSLYVPELHILNTTTLSDTQIQGGNCEPDYCRVINARFDSTQRWVAFSVTRISESTNEQTTDLYLTDATAPEQVVRIGQGVLQDYFQWLPDAPYLLTYLPDEQSFQGIPVLYHAPTRTMATLPLSEASYAFYYEWRAPEPAIP